VSAKHLCGVAIIAEYVIVKRVKFLCGIGTVRILGGQKHSRDPHLPRSHDYVIGYIHAIDNDQMRYSIVHVAHLGKKNLPDDVLREHFYELVELECEEIHPQ